MSGYADEAVADLARDVVVSTMRTAKNLGLYRPSLSRSVKKEKEEELRQLFDKLKGMSKDDLQKRLEGYYPYNHPPTGTKGYYKNMNNIKNDIYALEQNWKNIGIFSNLRKYYKQIYDLYENNKRSASHLGMGGKTIRKNTKKRKYTIRNKK